MAQQGIITCYINRDEYTEEYLDQLVASIKEANGDTIAKVKDQGYSVMFVITTSILSPGFMESATINTDPFWIYAFTSHLIQI